jgi:hypothetical protein
MPVSEQCDQAGPSVHQASVDAQFCFKKFRIAFSSTLIGIEAMHMLMKRKAGPMTPIQEAKSIYRIMYVANNSVVKERVAKRTLP